MVGSTELAPEAPVHREEAGVTIELAALGVPFGPISPCTGFSGLIRSPVAIDKAHANDGLYSGESPKKRLRPFFATARQVTGASVRTCSCVLVVLGAIHKLDPSSYRTVVDYAYCTA